MIMYMIVFLARGLSTDVYGVNRKKTHFWVIWKNKLDCKSDKWKKVLKSGLTEVNW